MYLNSGVDYYLVVLKDIVVHLKSGLSIVSPSIKFKLLSYPDLNKISIMEASGMAESSINEEVCEKCIIGVEGFDGDAIDFDESPAGIVDHISTKIKYNSLIILNQIEEAYNSFVVSSSLLERMSIVVSYYTNNSYEVTQQLPVDELVKRYTICSLAFPQQVPPLILKTEEESRVG